MVLRKILGQNITAQVRVFSRDEKKQDDMRHEIRDPRVRFYIGDVRDAASVSEAMNGVDLVFHAAALKQVPSCEFHPIQAVKTNILGTENVLTAAVASNVETVVVLSTDKAVYPINAMGMSKALMEKVAAAKARSLSTSGPRCTITRYGNVMASRGSVIPLFIKQILAGEPITVTDPDMTRFLMSLDDAVELVTHAFVNANQGDLFVQKAPAATVIDIANALKTLFSAKNPIKVIGTRHGEKKHETLLNREEMAKAEDLGRYYRVPLDNRDLNYSQFLSEGTENVTDRLDYTSENTTRLNVDELINLFAKLDMVTQHVSS